jgi:hypothetical protein
MSIHLPEVREWLNRYGALMCHTDVKTVAGYWDVPAKVLSDTGDAVLDTSEAVETYITNEQRYYESSGVASTIPRVEQADELGEDLIALQVRWTNLDYNDGEVGEDRVHYVLHRGEDGKLRVQMTTPLSKAL